MSSNVSPAQPSWWQRFTGWLIPAFHAYANWLVGISWRRFALLSLLLLILTSIVEELPPLRWQSRELVVDEEPPEPPKPAKAPKAPPAKPPAIIVERPDGGVEVQIDENGVRVTRKPAPGASAPASASAASAAQGPADVHIAIPDIHVPAGSSDEVREAVVEAREEIIDAIRDAADAARDAAEAKREALEMGPGPHWRIRTIHLGDFLTDLAFIWIFGSAIIKIAYKRQLRAEAVAAEATEVAEAESLKRQVVEARMAAMQAQVEPHFLFNTLASIDHLIETDPPRASKMQRNLISLLRASMPTMREANSSGLRDLGRELSVIRPYLEILKVRMEERLQTRIDVPEGLYSAEFPPMMIQGLVENAIKHGLEPKPEGGELVVKAEILHGKLAVTVADTGLGFGKAATAGTGVGLANIRERLQLLYGHKATLTVAENQPSGTVVTIVVPYAARAQDGSA